MYAATGLTAAELIAARAKAELPNMGLTTWKGAGRGRALTKADIGISKNYLNREEVTTLELLVGQYLDFAEMQARQRKVMTMQGWIEKLDAFLKINDQAFGMITDRLRLLFVRPWVPQPCEELPLL